MKWRYLTTAWLVLSTSTSFSLARNGRKCSFEGYYDANANTLQPCPGVLPCEPGYYCTGGQRLPCPSGTFGAETKLRTSDCTGMCPPGFYCPEGTVSPIECNGADVYCPIGSVAPVVVPDGYYSVGVAWRRRDRVTPCEMGYYCREGIRLKCPAGTYGATTALKTSKCTDKCPAGTYCVEGSAFPTKCPGGVYGTRTGETDPACSGPCQEGYYCPPGSISATENLCGTGKYCPQGSSEPQSVMPGSFVYTGDSKIAGQQHLCPTGSYCTSIDGAAELCPGGTYGATEGLTTARCSGLCAPGYYCPKGSSSRTANVCGSGPDVFCPEGSAVPTSVLPGYYTVGILSLPGRFQVAEDVSTRFAQYKCEPGHYCIDGVRFPCPGGTFGNSFALASASCSGLCQEGYYCPPQSIVATAQLCGGNEFYCPPGSALPTPVSVGYCTISDSSDSMIRVAQRRAQPGEFAWMGTCYPCPAGRYGVMDGETNSLCTGFCTEGYYCPPGSSSPTQIECGGAHVYCPLGSKAPIPVDQGYYTSIGIDEQCPPGSYRDFTTTISAFIDVATGRSTTAVNYGDALYPLAKCAKCPVGTFKPAYGDALTDCIACPLYTTTSTVDRRSCQCFRLAGGSTFDSTIMQLYFNMSTLTCVLKELNWLPAAVSAAQKSVFTRSQQYPCQPGYACSGGIRTPCPAGTYGDIAMETRVATCAGSCSPGFYCPLASTNSTPIPCGDASVYCPQGSLVPIPVTPGYYTIRSPITRSPPSAVRTYNTWTQSYDSLNATINAAIRDDQQLCEVGYYCVQGLKFICPPGRYGNQQGEVSPLCAGPCTRGYYCPAGSTSPTQHTCGSYNIKEASNQICRTGSATPTSVLPGYYSVGGDPIQNATRFYQRPCEPGYYCIKGIKYQCPAGTYGAISGLTTSQCSGPCQAGYYCPSYPNTPSISATQLECGDPTVYCPKGTGNQPLQVTSGYYSVGAGDGTGDARNTTRIAQVRCPRGYYCRKGIMIQCPEGTYGDREGLTSTQCSGWCPAGYFCPKGTITYQSNPCPAATFAIAGSAQCMDCGGTSATQGGTPASIFSLVSETFKKTPCVDKRTCCFFG